MNLGHSENDAGSDQRRSSDCKLMRNSLFERRFGESIDSDSHCAINQRQSSRLDEPHFHFLLFCIFYSFFFLFLNFTAHFFQSNHLLIRSDEVEMNLFFFHNSYVYKATKYRPGRNHFDYTTIPLLHYLQ